MLVCVHSLLALFREGSGGRGRLQTGRRGAEGAIKIHLNMRVQFLFLFLSQAVQGKKTAKCETASSRWEGAGGTGRAAGRRHEAAGQAAAPASLWTQNIAAGCGAEDGEGWRSRNKRKTDLNEVLLLFFLRVLWRKKKRLEKMCPSD